MLTVSFAKRDKVLCAIRQKLIFMVYDGETSPETYPAYLEPAYFLSVKGVLHQ